MFGKDKSVLVTLVLAALAAIISAECPNACSSHGKCGAYDSCECYRNWMSNDCSERVCQFGLAHVDSPKGDLDASSGELHSPESLSAHDSSAVDYNAISLGSRIAKPVVVGDAMYPKGTYEKYPNMVTSTNYILSNTAHDYMECSNKGICDRADGICVCFEGYEGSACQRASCPISNDGVCSGHGTCSTIGDIARADYNNSYNLWDEHVTMGCLCDPGFEGPDCSKAVCKYGADPLYSDDEVNMRYANFTFALWNIARYNSASGGSFSTDGTSSLGVTQYAAGSNFSIVFYDRFGQPWWSDPIDIDADCDVITDTLEALPNNVFKAGSILCSHDDATLGTYMFEEDTTTGKAGDVGFTLVNGVKPKYVKGLAEGYPIKLPTDYYATDATDTTATIMPLTRKKFTLAFPANPGKLRQPEIDLYLDGSRPTVSTGDSNTHNVLNTNHPNRVYTWVYPNGFTGEDIDFVPDLCANVRVKLEEKISSKWTKLVVVDDNSDGYETKLLKRCLGDADGVMSNNNEIGFTGGAKDEDEALFNWDYGIEAQGATGFDKDNVLHPHLIKLVPTSAGQTRLCNTTGFVLTGVDNINEAGYCRASDPAGFYGVLYYRDGEFIIMSRAHQGYSTTAQFNVFTTTGYLSLASKKTDVFTSIGDITNKPVASNVAEWTVAVFDLKSFYSNVVYTLKNAAGGINNVDCETQSSNTGADNVYQCIEKGDYVMIFDLDATSSNNPKYPNMYQVMKISRENREAVQDMQLGFESSTGPDTTDTYQSSSSATYTDYAHFERLRYQIVLDYGMNARYNKIDLTETGAVTNNARIYKFTPPSTHVKWVGQCSNRGICDSGSGICRCFPGYSGDDCSTMNALAQ
jgi:hypothetical protein